MSYSIEEIEGIGPVNGDKLAKAGIKTTAALLKRCCDRKGRKTACEKTGIAEQTLLKWTNMADLMRISGIGPEFSELLEATGVDTIKELRHRNAENLAEKMAEVNRERQLTRQVPGVKQTRRWIEAAKNTEPLMTY